MSIPRGLSEQEAEAWAKLASTVTPLHPPQKGEGARPRARSGGGRGAPATAPKPASAKVPHLPLHPAASRRDPPLRRGEAHSGLDSHWDRKLKAGSVQPDFTLDLHGHSLDAAYDRLMDGIEQARAVDARVVLLIAGRSRPTDPADRAEKRGAIRAKLLDWLAASRHSDAIAAVRKAHIRHGGGGALYLVLKRGR